MSNVFIFFHSVKKIYLFLIVITIFIGCKKNSTNVVQNNIESPVFTETVSPMNHPFTYEDIDDGYYAIVNANAVRIRDQPSLEGIIIGHLNSGMAVNVLGRTQNRMSLEGNNTYWLKININDVDGWAYGAYIDLHDTQYDSLPILTSDKPASYFTEEFLERAITEPNLSDGDIIFDETKSDGLRIYYGGRLFYGSDSLLRYMEYGNRNIILVTQEVEGIEYVRDYLILEKQNLETYLSNASGTVEIDGEFTNRDVTVVVNRHWQGGFTDDISQAFRINAQTRKIEPVIYDRIRLHSEL